MPNETDHVDLLEGEVLPLDIPDWEDDTGVKAIQSVIPFMSSNKALYLSHRAMGFNHRESLGLVGVGAAAFSVWRKDPKFMDYLQNRLEYLQEQLGPKILHLEFTRNMRLALRNDFKILYKTAIVGVHRLTEREYSYLKDIRKHYTPGELLNLDKVLKPGLSDEEQDPLIAFLGALQKARRDGLSAGNAGSGD